jgi:hypothetical protein
MIPKSNIISMPSKKNLLIINSLKSYVQKKSQNYFSNSFILIYFEFQSSFMENEKYLAQLQEIQSMMQKSSKFLSLSGISGILAGTYALIGAGIVYSMRERLTSSIRFNSAEFITIVVTAILVMVLSLATGIIFSIRKARKKQEVVWNHVSRLFIMNFMVPLITGGLFAIILISKGSIGLVSPVTLLFYGLSLVSASRYSYETLRNLGFIFIILGLLNSLYIGYGLYFWMFGFGVCHIFYGAYMYLKYDYKK